MIPNQASCGQRGDLKLLRFITTTHAWRPALAGAALLFGGTFALASSPPWGVPSGSWPWARPSHQGYQEPVHPFVPPVEGSLATAQFPSSYRLEVEPLAVPAHAIDKEVAQIVAHLPEHARIWFQGVPMADQDEIRTFRSPPLKEGVDYSYDVRVAWLEDGKWVKQERTVSIRPGQIQCLYIVPAKEAVAGGKNADAKIQTNLAKLSPADRKLAEQQQFCAVQNDKRLGSMGVPAKVMVNAHPVFLCCSGCTETAQENPARTLATVQKLKAHPPIRDAR